MKVVAFVPMKMNNERAPGKNTMRLSDGKPICELMFNTLLNVKEIDSVYCFCSNEEICQYLPDKIKFLKRDPSLDSPETKGNDLIESFINKIDADIYVKAHVTAPFLSSNTISECIQAVLLGNYDSATPISSVNELLWDDFGPINYDPNNIARTQDVKHIFRETTGAYIFKKSVFVEHHRRIGFNPYFKEVGVIEGLDYNYPEDFEVIDAVYMSRKYSPYK